MDCASDKIVSFEFVLGRQLTRENSLGSKKSNGHLEAILEEDFEVPLEPKHIFKIENGSFRQDQISHLVLGSFLNALKKEKER